MDLTIVFGIQVPTGEVFRLKSLKKNAVPHLFPWRRESRSSTERKQRARKRLRLEDNDMAACPDVHVGAYEEAVHDENGKSAVQTDSRPQLEKETQTASKGITANDYQFNDKLFHRYTGLENYNNFDMVFTSFGSSVMNMSYYYGFQPVKELRDQFFLTLLKLRMNRLNWELADMFKITEKEVTNIFVTWVNFIYFHMKDLDWWPSRELVHYYAPTDFRRKFSSTRVIVDGTEMPLKKAKQPIVQQATYSTYKNRNTVKALVGVTPGGLVSYISDIYGGSASDRQICERSTLMRCMDSGDSIMADKGFNVQDLFIPCNVTVNLPAFFKKKNRMSGREVVKDRKIASKRVHVERIIGLAKTFKILSCPFSIADAPISDAIICSCFFCAILDRA
ncbi:hypothetical protein ScPMuIL_015112 [Solemya velum]